MPLSQRRSLTTGFRGGRRGSGADDPSQLLFEFRWPETTPVARAEPRPRVVRTELIPFPLARRRPLVEQLARLMTGASSPQAGEWVLEARLARRRRVLQRQCVDGKIIDAELRALDAAVRAELWRLRRGRSRG